MKILHVVRQYAPAVGGLETYVGALAAAQRRAGLEPRVLTLDTSFADPDHRLPARQVIDDIEVRRIRWHGSRRYPLAPGVLRHLADCDLVHVHAVDFFADWLSFWRPLHGKPMVLSTHGGFFHSGFARGLKQAYFRTVTRATLREYHRILACSAGDQQLFSAICHDRLFTVENGVDTTRWHMPNPGTFEPGILCLGRIAPHKGHTDLIAAFECLAQPDTSTHLHIVGPDWDGALAAVAARIAISTQRDRITLHGALPHDRVRDLARRCALIVSASRYEGFGLAVVEGMAAGLIPVANDIPSFREIVHRAGLGEITDFTRPEAAATQMAAALATCRAEPRLNRERVRAAAAPYDWASVEQTIRSHYDAILGRRRRVFFGVGVAVTTRNDAVRRLGGALRSAKPTRVAFANANLLNYAATSPELRADLRNFLVLNDGIGVDLAARIKYGAAFPQNMNGTDFTPYFLDRVDASLRIFLYGAQPESVAACARLFKQRWPRHTVVGYRHGYGQTADGTDVASEIRAAGAEVVLVALGNPIQEQWIARHGEASGATVLIGVGALFDFLSGTAVRAPAWVRRRRAEWIWRLVREPRRLLLRYTLGNATFLARAATDVYRLDP